MAKIQALESIERFARILSAINAADGITMSGLSQVVDLPRSAVNRYILSLLQLGYIFRDERSLTYQVTSKTFELSKGATRDQALRLTVLPILHRTCRKIGWSLNFTTLKNAQLTLIANTDALSPLVTKQRRTILMRPLLGRAAGHVLLAYLTQPVRDDVLTMAKQQSLTIYEESGIDPKSIQKLLSDIVYLGYAASKTVKKKLNTIAVPVHLNGAVPFCVSVGVNDSILSLDQVIEGLLEPLLSCSEELKQCLSDLDTSRWQKTMRAARIKNIGATA
ncbi:MAG: IclR family transcriptional regulator [Rhodospirillales bacterium]